MHGVGCPAHRREMPHLAINRGFFMYVRNNGRSVHPTSSSKMSSQGSQISPRTAADAPAHLPCSPARVGLRQ